VAVIAQHRCAYAHAGLPCGRGGIGTELMVEAPLANVLPQHEQLRHALRIGQLAEDAVEGGQCLLQHLPAMACTPPHAAGTPLQQHVAITPERPGPHAFAFDLRIVVEQRLAGYRQTHVNGIAERIGGKTKPQRYRPAAY